MSLSRDLVQHSIYLLDHAIKAETDGAQEADLRRAISAAYYAVFHCLSEAAVNQLAPHASSVAANRIYRWLDHSEMKRICEQFAAAQLRPPLRELLGDTASADMQNVALSFIKLQEARHSADYDRAFQIVILDALEFVSLAANAIEVWERIAQSSEANVFVLSLLLWKNWEKRA